VGERGHEGREVRRRAHPWRFAALMAPVLACTDLQGASEVVARSDVRPTPTALQDPVWHDGQAEKCVYEATRTIYGVERRYLAIAYTNRENVDVQTTCKAADDQGLGVFKHHWSEIVPTEKYDYRFSTMCYVRASDRTPFKLTVSTQEDCGASFKECWYSGGTLKWWESVYFPGTGHREGDIDAERDTQFADALPLVLRASIAEPWAHANPEDASRSAPPQSTPAERVLRLIPSQKDTRRASWVQVLRRARIVGVSVQDLPIGKLEAKEIELLDDSNHVVERYWFATDAKPPMLNAMVRYEGPGGVTYRLKSIERTKYWER
jgi:hypothetical protein